jgi:hypothetical protein
MPAPSRSWRAAAAALLLGLGAIPDARAEGPRLRLDLEGGATWTARNDVRVPGNQGTQFAMDALTGEGPSGLFRAALAWDPWERHGVRVVYQYLRAEGTGTLGQPTLFAGGTYAPGVPTEGHYRFDTWRATWRYTVLRTEAVTLRLGLTGLVRDAEIRLSQGGTSSRDSDVGFVPLLHASLDWRLAPRLTAMAEIDALGARQGYAVDLGLRLGWDVDRNWQVTGGYRLLDGGVDNSSTFAFATFHSLTAGVAYRF